MGFAYGTTLIWLSHCAFWTHAHLVHLRERFADHGDPGLEIDIPIEVHRALDQAPDASSDGVEAIVRALGQMKDDCSPSR